MSEWKSTTFQSVIDISKGDYITKKEAKPGPYPVILGGREPAYYIDRFNHTGRAIVVSRSGASAGFVSRWDEPIFVTDGFIIEPKEGIDYEFVYYALKNNEVILQRKQSGAAIPHVTPRLIYGLQMLLPDHEKQCRISSILSAYDSLIETNQRQIKLLEEASQRLYKEWFVDLRFPGHENVPVMDGVPEGWEKQKLIHQSSVLRRGISPVYNDDGKFTVISQKCIRSAIMNIAESRRQEKEYSEELNLQDCDIVICSTGTGTLGRVGQVFGEYPNTTFDSHVTLVRAKQQPNFHYHAIKSQEEYLMGMGRGSTNQQELYRNVIEGLDILIPTDEVLTRAEKLFANIHEKITAIKDEIFRLSEARDRLLPKLMSGEIAV